jgi:hypothetical protein
VTGQAEVVERQGAAEPAVTSELAALLRRMWSEPLDARAATVGKQCLLDWLGVSLAARREPLVDVLIEEFAGGGAGPQCALVGRGRRAPLHEAVLINGATGHALDFDDVLAVMGHPTVPVAPVAPVGPVGPMGPVGPGLGLGFFFFASAPTGSFAAVSPPVSFASDAGGVGPEISAAE